MTPISPQLGIVRARYTTRTTTNWNACDREIGGVFVCLDKRAMSSIAKCVDRAALRSFDKFDPGLLRDIG